MLNLVWLTTDDDYVEMRDTAPAWERSVRVAALIVWAVTALAVIAARVETEVAVLLVAGIGLLALLGARGKEITLGALSLLVGAAWILVSTVLALVVVSPWWTHEPFSVDGLWLAIYVASASLGLIPLFLGVSFVFAVGPFAKPVNEPERRRRPSGRAVLASLVAVFLVMAMLYVARSTIASEGAPPGRGSWERELRAAPGPNIGKQVEDPALVRRLRGAAGASGTVDVEVTVFDAGSEGHAPAVIIRADDVLTYLGRRLNRIRNALDGSEIFFFEISDADGDEVLVYGDLSATDDWPGFAYGVPGEGPSVFWVHRDVQECFYSSSLDPGPPCPIDFSR